VRDDEAKAQAKEEGEKAVAADPDDEAKNLKRVILYQKINAYPHREFFGTPLILSVPPLCTYRELYEIVVKRCVRVSVESFIFFAFLLELFWLFVCSSFSPPE
jgi:hypothetical protein